MIANGGNEKFSGSLQRPARRYRRRQPQAYILRLMKERGFLETVFNAIEEGILVIDRHLLIRYHNRAAREILALPDDLSEVRVSQLLQGVDWLRILGSDERSG